MNKPDEKSLTATAVKSTLLIPVMLIAVGPVWLFTTVGVAPGINWIWTLGLVVIGLLAFLISGFDKVTLVIGPFFIIASLLSVLRQTERIHVDVEMPILVIVAGFLFLFARSASVSHPKWFIVEPRKS